MAYLLDSDILVDLSRGNVAAGDYVDSLGNWSLSMISGLELLAAKDSAKWQRSTSCWECTSL